MIVVDTETTGLLVPETREPERQPGIVQIALIKCDDNFNILAEQAWLIDPERPVWEPDAIKVHGITPEMIKGKPSLYAVIPNLVELFLGEADWIGFNNKFDRDVMFFNLMRYGLETRFPWPFRDIDIMKIAKPILNIAGKRDIKPPNLSECHKLLFGDTFASAHDALADCRATLRCAVELRERGYM